MRSLFITFLCFWVSCSSLRNFKVDKQKLKIGSSKIDVANHYGKPNNKGTFEKGGDWYQYYFKEGDILLKQLTLEFKEDKLYSYIFNSTFSEDSSNFDFDSSNKIIENEHSVNDVISIMGEPSGIIYFPSNIVREQLNDKGSEFSAKYAYDYTYSFLRKLEDDSTENVSQRTVVLFASNDKVLKVFAQKNY